MKEIPPGFDIIVRIDAEKFSTIWQSLQFLLASVQADLAVVTMMFRKSYG